MAFNVCLPAFPAPLVGRRPRAAADSGGHWSANSARYFMSSRSASAVGPHGLHSSRFCPAPELCGLLRPADCFRLPLPPADCTLRDSNLPPTAETGRTRRSGELLGRAAIPAFVRSAKALVASASAVEARTAATALPDATFRICLSLSIAMAGPPSSRDSSPGRPGGSKRLSSMFAEARVGRTSCPLTGSPNLTSSMSSGGTLDGLTSELHCGLAVCTESAAESALSGRLGRKPMAVLGRLGVTPSTSSDTSVAIVEEGGRRLR
mmetsp:Transcript_21784/g.39062  ORF Transcript_21784/g.39062 Transcript_21784/m.39062 type:complete len:264 (+) Transcript_21784:196-987(+)